MFGQCKYSLMHTFFALVCIAIMFVCSHRVSLIILFAILFLLHCCICLMSFINDCCSCLLYINVILAAYINCCCSLCFSLFVSVFMCMSVFYTLLSDKIVTQNFRFNAMHRKCVVMFIKSLFQLLDSVQFHCHILLQQLSLHSTSMMLSYSLVNS